MLSDHLASVRRRIQQACLRSGRDPASVTLVAVTKGVSGDVIQQALALGMTDLGENRVQEARAKQLALGSGLGVPDPEPRAPSPELVRWHLIGHLQRNKVRLAVELFDVVHSVDSVELVEALGEAASRKLQAAGRRLATFIQVNISGEPSKFGCQPEETPILVQAISGRPQLKLTGLMALAPFSENPEDARPHFRRLRQLRDDLVESGVLQPAALSMGMSNDFEVAIEEGATIVRIGTALFGRRT